MKKVFTPAAKVINVILMVTPFLLCWFFYYEPRTMTVNAAQVSVILIALYCMAYCYLARRLDGFRLQIAQVRDLAFGQIIAAQRSLSFGCCQCIFRTCGRDWRRLQRNVC